MKDSPQEDRKTDCSMEKKMTKCGTLACHRNDFHQSSSPPPLPPSLDFDHHQLVQLREEKQPLCLYFGRFLLRFYLPALSPLSASSQKNPDAVRSPPSPVQLLPRVLLLRLSPPSVLPSPPPPSSPPPPLHSHSKPRETLPFVLQK